MNIARLRKLKGWSQNDLANIVGVEQPTISRIEKGADSVTLRLLNSIADALEVPVHVLLLDESDEAELRLLQIYRSLSDERKRGWDDLANAVLADARSGDQ